MRTLRTSCVLATIFLMPGQAWAAEKNEDGFNFTGVQSVVSVVINWLLVIAPALIVLSFAWSAFLWTVAGHNKNMVAKAKKQFVVTCISLAVIGGFFLIKGIILGLALGSFGEGASSGDY